MDSMISWPSYKQTKIPLQFLIQFRVFHSVFLIIFFTLLNIKTNTNIYNNAEQTWELGWYVFKPNPNSTLMLVHTGSNLTQTQVWDILEGWCYIIQTDYTNRQFIEPTFDSAKIISFTTEEDDSYDQIKKLIIFSHETFEKQKWK